VNYERSYRARGTILYGGLNIFFSMQKSEYASVYNAFLNTNKKNNVHVFN